MNSDNRSKAVRISIIVLVALLVISVTTFAGTIFYRSFVRSQEPPAVAPDNVITSEKTDSASALAVPLTALSCGAAHGVQIAPLAAARSTTVDQASGENITLKIYRYHANDSTPFYADNMFPGDVETKTYYLEVSYRGSVTLNFHADIHNGYEKLAEVLKCRISVGNRTLLYDGLMRDMPQSVSYVLPQSGGSTESIIYKIEVYLDTSVGNEYMSRELKADFRWWVNEDSSPAPTPTQSGNPGELIPPQSGDDMHLFFWILIATVSMLLMIILICINFRRKTGGQ